MRRGLKFYELFYIFLFGCIFGYVVEVLWSYYRFQIFINHTALVIGPFNLVYGLTAMMFSFVLYKYKRDSILELFIMSFLLGTLIEYTISLGMEKLFGFVAWNYKRYLFNINGRVCLRYSIFWGLLGVVWVKLILFRLLNVIDKIPRKSAKIFMYIMIVFLIFDEALTVQAIERAKEKDRGIEASNKYEEFLDNTFNRDYLNNMFNRRWNKK